METAQRASSAGESEPARSFVDVLIGALLFVEAYSPAFANASKHTTDIMIALDTALSSD